MLNCISFSTGLHPQRVCILNGFACSTGIHSCGSSSQRERRKTTAFCLQSMWIWLEACREPRSCIWKDSESRATSRVALLWEERYFESTGTFWLWLTECLHLCIQPQQWHFADEALAEIAAQITDVFIVDCCINNARLLISVGELASV